MLSALLLFILAGFLPNGILSVVNKLEYQEIVKNMFNHAFSSYMDHAFPADELMPLSCKGRYRGSEISRGDIDDSLGNFTLTLIDALDTLFVLKDYPRLESSILDVMRVSFETDVEVSLFETNIRVLGGLLGGHTSALLVKKDKSVSHLKWYTKELLDLAVILGDKLLPAFETETGVPYSRINLKRGVTERVLSETNTCTACAGTLILEFGALSRLTGNPIYETKAKKALETIFNHRNRHSDLVGSVINVHTGNWIRPDSGVGAGVDSYYEYLLKAYILFGDEGYLDKFHTHYTAIKKYMQDSDNLAWPFLFLNVEMHRPLHKTRMFLDALLAFWPGMNVLFGDVVDGIAMHEMFHQVIKRHKFLPEAFTPDLKIHWPYHLLRPEFVESTFFLYEATKDPYYVEVAASIVDNLEKYARVDCGYAAIKDVRTLEKFDQMDSFFLAETFKYLYLIFSPPEEIPIDLKDYIFTTEAHLLPISLSMTNRPPEQPSSSRPLEQCQNLHVFAARSRLLSKFNSTHRLSLSLGSDEEGQGNAYLSSLYNSYEKQSKIDVEETLWSYNDLVRSPLEKFALQLSPLSTSSKDSLNLDLFRQAKGPSIGDISDIASLIQINNDEHIDSLKKMGIVIKISKDNKVELVHNPHFAESQFSANQGLSLLQQLMKLNEANEKEAVNQQVSRRHLTILNPPFFNSPTISGGPSQFGTWPQENIKSKSDTEGRISPNNFVLGPLVIVEPINACSNVQPLGYKSPKSSHFPNIKLDHPPTHSNTTSNLRPIKDSIAIVMRGDCMFIEKARVLREYGAIGMIVVDNTNAGSIHTFPPFSMSADKPEDVSEFDIPAMFLYNEEATELLKQMAYIFARNHTTVSSAFMTDQKDVDLATMMALSGSSLTGLASSHFDHKPKDVHRPYVTMRISFQEVKSPSIQGSISSEIMSLKNIRFERHSLGIRMRLEMPRALVDSFFIRDFSQLVREFDRIILASSIDHDCHLMLKKLFELAHHQYGEKQDTTFKQGSSGSDLFIPKEWSTFFLDCLDFEMGAAASDGENDTPKSEIVVFFSFEDIPAKSNIPKLLRNTMRIASSARG